MDIFYLIKSSTHKRVTTQALVMKLKFLNLIICFTQKMSQTSQEAMQHSAIISMSVNKLHLLNWTLFQFSKLVVSPKIKKTTKDWIWISWMLIWFSITRCQVRLISSSSSHFAKIRLQQSSRISYSITVRVAVLQPQVCLVSFNRMQTAGNFHLTHLNTLSIQHTGARRARSMDCVEFNFLKIPKALFLSASFLSRNTVCELNIRQLLAELISKLKYSLDMRKQTTNRRYFKCSFGLPCLSSRHLSRIKFSRWKSSGSSERTLCSTRFTQACWNKTSRKKWPEKKRKRSYQTSILSCFKCSISKR